MLSLDMKPKEYQKVKNGKDRISNVCMPDKFSPRVHLEGVTFNINDTGMNAPIIIGGDFNSSYDDLTDYMLDMGLQNMIAKTFKNKTYHNHFSLEICMI